MNIRISPLSLGSLLLRPRKVVGCVIALALAIVIGVLVIGAAIFFNYQRHQWLKKLTSEAPAQVLAVKVTSRSNPTQNQNQNLSNNSTPTYSTRITYSFQAVGRTIETEWVKSGDQSDEYEVGRRAKVCYDPANPNDNEIFPLSYRCGQ